MRFDDGLLPEHAELLVVRHGESRANVAFREAEIDGEPIELGCRDADVALSRTGAEQAAALGRWLRERSSPQVVYCSPYLRARQTWQIAAGELSETQRSVSVVVDERLRDREMGHLELHTPAMVSSRYPEEARRRADVGEFYYRPPGGESPADVALRLRSFLRDLDRAKSALVVGHDAVVLLLRYITEAASEEELWRLPPVTNASVSRWEMSTAQQPRLVAYNELHHLPTESRTS
ncbi:histidine phosphatase family protein [Actinopolyspora erythraea]|uniref:histidine phosphatase family protein n=1 Tax=Actinopolyspora erythraea TaxID=414996 RepID=UPI000A7AD3E6|nr:histidine phosphatase family protein [Actinopolyspora erythraea]